MRLFVALFLAILPSLCLAETLSGRIVGVVDGDTVDLLVDGRDLVRVRIAGIDAPERGQPFGQRSKQKMSDMVFGKPADVVFDKRDRYGRTIGKVIVNGRDAGLLLIDSGLAWHYKKYEREQSVSDRRLYSDAEQQARRLQVGFWSESDPVPPWDWRKRGK